MSDASVSPEASPSRISLVRRPGWSKLAVAALALALLAALLAAVAGFGSRFGAWHFRTGFTLLNWAVYTGIAALLLAVAGAIHSRPGTARRGFPLALLALLIAAMVVYVPWNWRRTARSVPPIHDISTDTNNPPPFVAVVPLRADASNPVEYAGPEVAAQQREAYPDLQPVVLNLPMQRAFQRALDAARAMGWEIVAADAATGRIEATDQTFWFGFKDDVVIRLTPLQQRTIVDVRSKSRVGGSDVGTNAKRIREYVERVRE